MRVSLVLPAEPWQKQSCSGPVCGTLAYCWTVSPAAGVWSRRALAASGAQAAVAGGALGGRPGRQDGVWWGLLNAAQCLCVLSHVC